MVTLVMWLVIAGFVNESRMPVGDIAECEKIGYAFVSAGMAANDGFTTPLFQCEIASEMLPVDTE
jgi:hypothetical protein